MNPAPLTARHLAGVAGLLASAALAADYTVTDLGALGGPDTAPVPGSQAFAVNATGLAVGQGVLNNDQPDLRAIRSDGAPVNLGALDRTQSTAFGVNDAGVIVGVAFDLGALDPTAVRWIRDTPEDLGPFSPRGINNADVIVGEQTIDPMTSARRAVRYADGELDTLGTLGGGHSSAYAVADSGDIVGMSTNLDEHPRAFLYRNNLMIDLGTLGGAHSAAYDINDFGQAVGYARKDDGDPHAFRFDISPGGGVLNRVDLGVLGGRSSYAYGVNNDGVIVGVSDGRAFVFADGAMTDLNDRIDPDAGWELLIAHAINESGVIVGWGRRHGLPRGFRLDPIGELPADLDGDGDVDSADLAVLLAAWGPCPGCPADLNGDGVVNSVDLAILLAAWT